MNISQVNSINFGNAEALSKTSQMCNRNLLQKTTKLLDLKGPEEIKEAKKIVKIFAGTNAGIGAACAQVPGADELALMGEEMIMATTIVNGIYHLGFSKGFISSMLTALMGNRVGTTAFKFATKCVTWIPIFGNAINAGVAGTTTYALGMAIIDMCEKIERDKLNGKKITDILNGK